MNNGTNIKKYSYCLDRYLPCNRYYISHSLGSYWPGNFGNFIFAVHLPIFFVLSGYLYKAKSFLYRVRTGIKTLIIPYIATVMIEIAIACFVKVFPNNKFLFSRIGSIKGILLAAVYGSGGESITPFKTFIPWIGAIWFLLAFFWGSLIFNQIMKLSFKKYDLLSKFAIFSVLTLVGYYLSKIVTLPMSFNSALGSMLFFFAGYLIRRYKKLFDQLPLYAYLIFLASWTYVATLGLFSIENMAAPSIFLNLISSVADCLFLIKLSMIIDSWLVKKDKYKFRQEILLIGSGSLAILCFHLIDLDNISVWTILLKKLNDTVPYWFAIMIGNIYLIIFAYLVVKIIPFVPLLKSCFFPRKSIKK
ncbi:acyltransferase family protein [Oenococcus oeni]